MMTRDEQQSGEAVRGARMHLADAFTLAARVSPAVPQAQDDCGQICSDSSDISGSD